MGYLKKFTIIIYILLVYSGLIKWIPGIPVDLTVVFTVVLLLLFPFQFKRKISSTYSFQKVVVFSVIALSILFLLSNIYTISVEYASSKSIATILNIFCFIYPLFLFNEKDIPFAKKFMFWGSIVILSILSYLYFTDQFIYFQMSEETMEEAAGFTIPNYLSIGTFISIALILRLDDKSLFNRAFMLYSIFILFVLGGRGPLIFLFIIFILYYFMTFKGKRFSLKNLIIILFGAILFVQYFDFSVIDFERFNILENLNEDESSLSRIQYYNKGFQSVAQNLFAGLGIGSSGLILSDRDVVLYPHNLFLESLMEVGIIGGILYLILYIALFSKTIINRNDNKLLLLGLVVIYLFFQDMKSGSFDAWRISLMWISLFLIQYRSSFKQAI